MFASALAATAAHAQPTSNDQVARRHYDKGKQLAADGQFAAAYGEFSAGYDASPRALFLFNMAECERQLGNAQRARDFYERFLSASPNDALGQTARARLAELPAPPPHADAPISKASPPAAPPANPAEVAPATATTSSAQLSATVPTAAQRSLVAPAVAGVGALVLGGAALGLDLVGESTYHQSLHDMGAQQTSLWHTSSDERIAAESVGGAAAVCAGAAIWLYFRGDRHANETSARRTRIVPTAGGMAVLGSF
jgi:tetratricopeptide (TPR) repeat protein